MWTNEDVSESLKVIERNTEKSEFRMMEIMVAIKEMDDAQRFKLDRLHEQLKPIASMVNWCAVAAMVYIVTTVAAYFR